MCNHLLIGVSSLITSIGTLAVFFIALVSLIADHLRRKRQFTIEFYNIILYENDAFLYEIDEEPLAIATIKSDKILEKNVAKYLSSLERLAVGVSTNIYDL